MTAITSGTAAESRRSVGTRSLGSVLLPLVAAMLAVVVAYTGWLIVARAGLLVTWNDTFSGTGTVTVVGCEPVEAFGPDRWRCDARLTTRDTDKVETELIVGKDARLSSRPYVGQQIEVFYAPGSLGNTGSPTVVYARDAQLNELTRLYLALPPWTMILVGAAGSLLGLALDRLRARSPNAESWWRTSPLLLDLRLRGAIWLVVGVVTLGLYQLLVRYMLGSAGVA